MYIDWVELKSADDDDEIEVFQKQQQQRCSWNFTVKRMSPTNREWSACSSDERESQHSNQTAQNINFIFRSPRVDVVVVVSARCSTEFKAKPVDLICTRRGQKSCIELSRGADCSRWHFLPLFLAYPASSAVVVDVKSESRWHEIQRKNGQKGKKVLKFKFALRDKNYYAENWNSIVFDFCWKFKCVFHEFEFMPIFAGRFGRVHFGKLTSIVFAIQGDCSSEIHYNRQTSR